MVFFLSALAIVPLAKFLGESTEELATHTGPALGGFLNATFGNAPELVIGFFALRAGLLDVVKASITGSIISNLLLVSGTAILAGGIRYKRLQFNRTAALANSSMLILAVIALVIPAIFVQATHVNAATGQHLSDLVAVFMLLLYGANLIFTFFTHSHLYTEDVGQYEAKWSISTDITVLLATTLATAWLSSILVTAIRPTIVHLGWTQLFIGAVVIAIIGNVGEHTSAISMAVKKRMDLSLQISIGSATQIAMFVMPLLVLMSLPLHHTMDLVFNIFELITIMLAVYVTKTVVEDGETHWLEGAQLLTAYIIIATAFFLHP